MSEHVLASKINKAFDLVNGKEGRVSLPCWQVIKCHLDTLVHDRVAHRNIN